MTVSCETAGATNNLGDLAEGVARAKAAVQDLGGKHGPLRTTGDAVEAALVAYAKHCGRALEEAAGELHDALLKVEKLKPVVAKHVADIDALVAALKSAPVTS